MSKLFGLVDSRSKQGILARGKNVYNGSGTSPNPTGNNSSEQIKLRNKRKKASITPMQAKLILASRKKAN